MTLSETSLEGYFVCLLLLEATSDDPGDAPLYEETFALVKADSEATARRRVHSETGELQYENAAGFTVTWRLKKIIDINAPLDTELTEFTELYSRHFRNLRAYQDFEPLEGGKL